MGLSKDSNDFLRDSLRTLCGWWVFGGGSWPVGGGGEIVSLKAVWDSLRMLKTF